MSVLTPLFLTKSNTEHLKNGGQEEKSKQFIVANIQKGVEMSACKFSLHVSLDPPGPQSDLSLECAQRAHRPRCEISTIYFWQKLALASVRLPLGVRTRHDVGQEITKNTLPGFWQQDAIGPAAYPSSRLFYGDP